MAETLISVTGTTVTHDESAGLQTSGVATPTEDNNDDDVLFSSIPSAFSMRLSALTTATPIGAAESDGNVVTFSPAGTLGNIALTDAGGAPLDGDDSGLDTTAGEDILLFSDANDNIVLGRAGSATGDIVFAIYLEPTGGTPPTGAKLWTVQYEAIDHGDDGNDHDSAVDLTGVVHVTAFEQNDFSFANAPSGQNLFMMFGTTSQAILVTGEDPANESAGQTVSNDGDTVNTGKGGGATTLGTEGQQIKAQKALVVTFVTGANSNFLVPNLSPTEATDETNIAFQSYLGARAAQFTISQMTPGKSSTTATVEIEAYLTADGTGDNYIDNNPLVTGDTAVGIESVQVFRNDVDITGTMGVNVTISGHTATITGVKNGDDIQYSTLSDHNRVLIRNDQPAGSNVSFDLGGFTLTEVTGDTDEVGSKIFFEDDGPSIDLTPLSPTIVVDESVGADAGDPNANDEEAAGAPAGAIGYAAVAASTLFTETANPGTDGDAKAYSLVLNAGATGLTDTASDQAVVLSQPVAGGTIEGRTETGGDLVFTIEVDAATGDVEVAQFRALDHGADGNDHDSAVSMNSGLVELRATLTDGDTDFAADEIELGSLIDFEDDGPTIDLEPVAGAALVLDESVGADAGDPNADDEANANAPAGAIGYAEIAAANLFTETADAGSDGEASTAGKIYALVLNGTQPVDSGLTDTASGEAVELSQPVAGGTIEGRTATSDDLVFTIEVDAATGDVSVAQFRALDHGDDGNDHDSAVSMNSGLVELQATLTDGDTDFASDSFELGELIDFEDDGPTIDLASLAPRIVLDESVGADAGDPNANDEEAAGAPAGAIGYAAIAAGLLFTETADAGSDGEAGKEYALVLNAGATGLTDTASGQAVVLSQPVAGGTIEGRTETGGDLVFTIEVDAATGDVEVAQFRAIVHDDVDDPDEATSPATMNSSLVELQATLTDGDTDVASDTIELGSLIDFEDDGPVLEAAVDDGFVALGDGASDGDADLGLDYGSDGPGTLQITSFESMPDDTDLGEIAETLSAAGTVLTYSNEFGDLFRLTVSDNGTGSYTFEVLQDAPLVINTLDFAGNDPGGPVEEITITAPGGTDVTFDGFLITDFDANIRGQFAAGDLEPPDPDEADEDVNVSQQGVGLKDNQMDPLEALQLSFSPDVDGIRLLFEGATGGGNTLGIKIEAYDDGALVFDDSFTRSAPKGNAELIETFLFDQPVDEVYIALEFATPSSGVRIAEVSTIERGEIPDFSLDYTITATDEDGDHTSRDFTVDIDGNSDGMITIA